MALSYLDGTETADTRPMAQNVWTLAFVLALKKKRLGFFHGGRVGNGTLGTQGHSFGFASGATNYVTPSHRWVS